MGVPHHCCPFKMSCRCWEEVAANQERRVAHAPACTASGCLLPLTLNQKTYLYRKLTQLMCTGLSMDLPVRVSLIIFRLCGLTLARPACINLIEYL